MPAPSPVLMSAPRTAVLEIAERADRLGDDLVALAAVHVAHEVEPTRRARSGVVEPLRGGKSRLVWSMFGIDVPPVGRARWPSGFGAGTPLAALPGVETTGSSDMGQLGCRSRQDGEMRAPDTVAIAAAICADLDSSPTPYHAVETVRAHLEAAGFRPFTADTGPVGRWFHAEGGGIIAWVVAEHHDAASPLRIVGAHTDSPNLRIKPQPDVSTLGVAQLGVEVYGGALTNSWLDRDLGLAGRVAVRSGDGVQVRLVRDDRPLLRIPQLAIHLDGEFRSNGLNLNPQRHMVPMWGSARPLPSASTSPISFPFCR